MGQPESPRAAARPPDSQPASVDLGGAGLNQRRMDELREALGVDVLRQLLMTFRIENQGRLSRLRAAAESGPTEVGLVAHEVQGAAASVGADRLAFVARQLVQATRAGDDAAVVELTQSTIAEIQAIVAFLADAKTTQHAGY